MNPHWQNKISDVYALKNLHFRPPKKKRNETVMGKLKRCYLAFRMVHIFNEDDVRLHIFNIVVYFGTFLSYFIHRPEYS